MLGLKEIIKNIRLSLRELKDNYKQLKKDYNKQEAK
jgi:archaellum component FlaC